MVMVFMDDDSVLTTIPLKRGTVKKLKELWSNADDTYDSVINDLIERRKRKP